MASRGLEGVVATTSAVSSIIGSTLTYRGFDIEDLVQHSCFEETVYVLWAGRLPTPDELSTFCRELAQVRALPGGLLDGILSLSTGNDATGRLRTAVSALGLYEAEAIVGHHQITWATGVQLLAQMSSIVAAMHRLDMGKDPVAPDPVLSFAANFLYMLNAERPPDEDVGVLDKALILHADHELNASTFTARVTASTLASMHASVVAALCALSGPLHGGANEAVMRMLEEIAEVDQAASWVRAALGRGERIMGFGHRVYREGDPRARCLKTLSRRLSESRQDGRWYDISARVEQEVVRATGLLPNVDFYSASVYTYLGIPRALFVPIFALSRVAGWIAHIAEQYENNRLIRPRAEYTGPKRRPYIGMEKR